MHLLTKSGRKVYLPTRDEDAAINAGIATDPDTYELSNAEFTQLKRVGRPKSATPKIPTTLRLSPEVSGASRASGKGWQTRIDNALRDWLKTNSPV